MLTTDWFIDFFMAILPYLLLVGGTIGLIGYEAWKADHKKDAQTNADETTKGENKA
jgi:hypothetical protein